MQPWVNDGLLSRVDPEHYVTHLDFHIITRKSGEPARVVQSFCDHLLVAAAEMRGAMAGGK
jgi:hypothetical protein